MRIAFLNLCHTDPQVVARVAKRLTKDPDFDMYIHVDQKSDIEPFKSLLAGNEQVYFLKEREKVYWGGYNAIEATYKLLRAALASDRQYDYFVTLQNLDYPIKSNEQIKAFFEKFRGKEFIRGCPIMRSKDWHFQEKYKIYNYRDSDFYLKPHNKLVKVMWDGWHALCSVTTIGFNGVHRENGEALGLYYGCAQWAVSRELAEYLDQFEKTHPKFNRRMQHIKFPDEEYFHTVVHNSKFKDRCLYHDEPEARWLVNWRNLHYFEFPKEVTVLKKADYDKLCHSKEEELFCRKVRTGESDELMDLLDLMTEENR